MGIIKPMISGKSYSIWILMLNYCLYSMENKLKSDYDPGFRVSIINSCWIALESFLRECLFETVMRDYDRISLPNKFKLKQNYFQYLKNYFIEKEKIELINFKMKLQKKQEFADHVKSLSWYDLLKVCDQINFPIEKKIKSWEFTQNLYRLRNGLTHGQEIKIGKSNTNDIDDYLSKEYIKSLRYLNNKKIIDLNKLFENQDINNLLNQVTTNFIINETCKSLDDVSAIFNNTYTAAQYRTMRN